MKLIEKKLEELYIVKDGTHDSPKYVSSVDGFPLITSKNLKNGYIDISNVDYISSEDYNKINARSNVDFGDLLMPMIGSIGNPVLVNIVPEFAIKNVALFKKNVDDNSLEFLKHILNSSFFKKKLANDSKGGTQKFVSLGYLRKLKILIPEKIEDQNRIAEILSQAENLITQRKESILLLDELLKSTFLEMFGDPVRNEKGWELVPLSQLGSLDRGVSKHRPRNAPELLGGEYPLIQTGEVSNSGLYITKFTKSYSELGLKQSKIWDEGTLLITIAANIAQTSILTFKACFPDSIVGFISLKNESNTIFVHYLFSFFQAILEKNAPQAAQRNINLELLRKLLVPKPPIKLQNKFVTTVEKVEVLKKDYEASLKELENMSGVLSQKAFKGELKVKEYTNTEVLGMVAETKGGY